MPREVISKKSPQKILRERGKGSGIEGGRLVTFSDCGRFGYGNTTSRVPS